MKQRIKQYWQQLKALWIRYWNAVKGLNYGQVIKEIVSFLTILPGLLAWLVEVLAMVSSAICVVLAARQGYEAELWSAIVFSVLAGLFIGLAILSDQYTQPSDAKHGGGD